MIETTCLGRRVAVLPSWMVCEYPTLRAVVGFGAYTLGIAYEGWGVRITLIWWHVCVHWRRGLKPCSH